MVDRCNQTGTASYVTLPVFAIMGHPNEGKSTVVSTLAEDECVPVSRTPGETRRCHTYTVSLNGTRHLEFIDTPGFQNPSAILTWFEQFEGDEMNLVPSFLAAHAANPHFHHDLELLRPLKHQAGILYVADASRPLRDVDKVEMEILRLTGRPRMAILNRKRETDTFLEPWREAVGRRFNIIRDFNAHNATFQERVQLLEAMKVLNQVWEAPLETFLTAMKSDWQGRLQESSLILISLLDQVMQHIHRHPMQTNQPLSDQKAAAIQGYQNDIRQFERKARAAWCKHYHHPSLSACGTPADLAELDLFAEHVWRLLGFSKQQLITMGAITGGMLGAGADLAAGGLTFGILAASGALLGAVGGWRGAPRIGAKKLPLWPGRKTLAKEFLQVGPCRDIQLPSILIDRSLLYLQRLMNWSHGRRDPETFEQTLRTSGSLVAGWTQSQNTVLTNWLMAHRKSQMDTQTVDRELQNLIQKLLTQKDP